MTRRDGLLLALLVVSGLALLNRKTVTRNVTEGARTMTAIVSQDALANEAKYAPYIRAAETRYGIPSGMLHRLIKTESHFRTDIITGKLKSPVGALGIAQFMPATAKDLNVNPLDPIASIDAAGRYLKQVYGWVGKDWPRAVAAYNWGAGNVNKAFKLHGSAWAQHLPTETKNYVANIV